MKLLSLASLILLTCAACGGAEPDLSDTTTTEAALCSTCPNITASVLSHNCAGDATFKLLITRHSSPGFWARLYPDAQAPNFLPHWVPAAPAGSSFTFTDTFLATRAELLVIGDATNLVLETNENDNTASHICP